MAKRLFKLFGFAIHDAPGEAEAECALLQQQGVVDAVLSEDVDTIMFGCTRTLRNWSAEGSKAAKTPTHVTVYDVAELRQGETGLDREGMVLVAMMSGGDYIPEGVPGCGLKVACQAAKAGFGKRLCRIKRSDPGALREWREDLTRELRTNESKFFRVKHKALTIPDDFPSIEVLRYYTHPVVSQAATVERLRKEFPGKQKIDIASLREFTAQTFDWTFKIGAVKFIRVFAAGLLVQGLMELSRQDLESDDPAVREEVESKLVNSIKSTRMHCSTDATVELRMSFIPVEVVGVDLDAEEDELASTFGRSGLALNSDDEGDDDDEGDANSGPKKVFDPSQPDLAWVPETVAKLGVPLMVEDWEAKQRDKHLGKGKKAPVKRLRKKASDMPVGALDKYVKSSKSTTTATAEEAEIPAVLPSASQRLASQPPFSQPAATRSAVSTAKDDDQSAIEGIKQRQSITAKAKTKAPARRPSLDVNPWSIACSQTTPKASRTRPNFETIFISSSPAAPSPPPAIALDTKASQSFQSSTLQPANNNSQRLSFLDNPFSPASSPAVSPAPTKPQVDTTRKHNRTSTEETTVKPAAKRAQRPKAARTASPTRKPGRSSRGAPPADQPSIKSFSKLGKKDVAAMPIKTSRPSFNFSSDLGSDSDDGLEDIFNLGPKKKSSEQPKNHPPLFHNCTSNPAPPRNPLAAAVPPPKLKPITSAAPPPPITIPSSPLPAPSPSPFKSSSKMTRVYIPRTSEAGLGYFREVEVTHAEADRMMRDEAERERRLGRAPGAGARMWRESDVSIVDLTGED